MTVKHGPESDLGAIEHKVEGLGYKVLPLAGGSATSGTAARVETPAGNQKADDHHGHAGHDHKRDDKAEEVAGLHGHDHAPITGPWWNSAKGRLTIAGGVAVGAAFVVHYLWPVSGPWPFIAAMLVGLVPIERT